MMLAVSWLLYLFTLVATFAIVAVLPVVLLWHMAGCLRSRTHRAPLAVTLCVATGFLAGLLAAWQFRPSGWPLPLAETAYASANSDKYGHPLEHDAERLLLFLMFFGDLGGIAAGSAAVMTLRHRNRREQPA